MNDRNQLNTLNQSQDRYVLSIDPGYVNMGWCIVSTKSKAIHYSGTDDLGITKTTELSTICLTIAKWAESIATALKRHGIAQRLDGIVIEKFKEGINLIVCCTAFGAFAKYIPTDKPFKTLAVQPVSVRAHFKSVRLNQSSIGRAARKQAIIKFANAILLKHNPLTRRTITSDHIADSYLQAIYFIEKHFEPKPKTVNKNVRRKRKRSTMETEDDYMELG